MTKGSPDTLELFKSLLLPGKDVICDYASGIREDAEEMDWLKAVYRIEGISLILLISALVAGSVLFLDYRSLVVSLMKIAGLHIVIVVALFLVLTLSRTVLLAVGSINEGDSIIEVLTRGRGPVLWYRFIAGLLSLSASVVVISESGIGWSQLVAFSIFAFLILGSLGFAASGIISLIFSYMG